MSIIYAPHECSLGYDPDDLRTGTVAACACGRRWVVTAWTSHTWTPVRWYHLRTRSRLRAQS